jgi:MYXO-CTERM domain-containing protein
MRNKTFISSMVLSAACVSAANAAFQSIDNFQTSGGAVGSLASAANYGEYNDELGTFGLSGYRRVSGQYYGTKTAGNFTNGQSTQGTATVNSSSSVAIGSGSMNMSYGGNKASSSSWKNQDGSNNLLVDGDNVTSQSATVSWDVSGGTTVKTTANWSTLTSLSFDISNYSTSGLITANNPHLYLSMAYLIDPSDLQSQAWHRFDITLADGSVSLSQSAITAAGVNLSAMLSVSMIFTNTNQTLLTGLTGVGNIPAGTLDISNFGVSGVPAPGAIALLGLAGLGARRRRD